MSNLSYETSFEEGYGGVVQRVDGQPDNDENYTYFDSSECAEMTKHLSDAAREILDVLLIGGFNGSFTDLIDTSALLAGDRDGA